MCHWKWCTHSTSPTYNFCDKYSKQVLTNHVTTSLAIRMFSVSCHDVNNTNSVSCHQVHQSYKQNSCTQSRYWERPKISNHVMQKISTPQRLQMHLRVSSAPLQSKRSSSIQQLLCYGDRGGFLSFYSLIKSHQ